MEKKNKGITLIALVVTIVVLLILAGISISMLTGENGVITQARKSKEETRGGTVEEQRDLWRSNNKLDKQTGDNTTQTLNELLADLIEKNELTEVERDKILDEGFVIIGSHYIDFTLSDEDDEIDWSKLGPGLYKTGTKEMIKSWQQLIDDGDIIVTDNSKLQELCTQLKGDLLISNEISEISSAFSTDGCHYINGSYLTGVFIPNSVSIANGFSKSNRLQRIVIQEGVKSITYMAFNSGYWSSEANEVNLVIEIPSSVTSIETGAFAGHTGSVKVKVNKNNTVYDSRDNCNAIIETSSNKLIQGFKTTTIPNTVTSIDDRAFCLTVVDDISIPKEVITIGEGAFSQCYNLTNITIPDSITSINNGAFCACHNLKIITLPDSITSIGDSSFTGCENLTTITIPKSVTSIGKHAFNQCDNLKTVNYEGSEEDWSNIAISDYNGALINATKNYNYQQ